MQVGQANSPRGYCLATCSRCGCATSTFHLGSKPVWSLRAATATWVVAAIKCAHRTPDTHCMPFDLRRCICEACSAQSIRRSLRAICWCCAGATDRSTTPAARPPRRCSRPSSRRAWSRRRPPPQRPLQNPEKEGRQGDQHDGARLAAPQKTRRRRGPRQGVCRGGTGAEEALSVGRPSTACCRGVVKAEARCAQMLWMSRLWDH